MKLSGLTFFAMLLFFSCDEKREKKYDDRTAGEVTEEHRAADSTVITGSNSNVDSLQR